MKKYSCRVILPEDIAFVERIKDMLNKMASLSTYKGRYYCPWCGLPIKKATGKENEEEHTPGWIKDI